MLGQKHTHPFKGDSSDFPDPRNVAKTAPCCCIWNYDRASEKGSHWVAAVVTHQNVTYFDSYGLAPDSADLLVKHRTYFRAWLGSVCKLLGLPSYSWNKADLQELTAQTCGHWSLYLCKQGPREGWIKFGPDRDKNDHRIRELVVLEDQVL